MLIELCGGLDEKGQNCGLNLPRLERLAKTEKGVGLGQAVER
jgi:hypothetical protein